MKCVVLCVVFGVALAMPQGPQPLGPQPLGPQPQGPQPLGPQPLGPPGSHPQPKPVVLPSSRGCIYIMGRCAEACPEGTHAYTTGCGFLLPEATCENPKPVADTRGMICDYSSCYCDAPTVRDVKTNHCVTVDKCTPQ